MEVNPANRREKIISLTETGKQYARELILPLFQSCLLYTSPSPRD